MGLFKGFTQNERRIFIGSVIAAILCFACFASDDLFWWLTANHSGRESGEAIGTISFLNNDVRYKGARSFAWGHASKSQAVHVGDAVYCSENSTAKISFDKNQSLEVEPSSLVHFSDIDGQKLTDLQLGHFRVQVNGQMKVAVHGVATVIEGEGGEADLEIRDNAPPVVHITKGKVRVNERFVKAKQASPILPIERFVASTPPKPTAESANSPAPAAPNTEAPVVNPSTAALEYKYKIYDVYKADEQSLKLRPLTETIEGGPSVSWSQNPLGHYEFEQSSRPDFDPAEIHFATAQNKLQVNKSYIGSNYWHVRTVGGSWGPVQKYEVEAKSLPVSPSFTSLNTTVTSSDKQIELKWNPPAETANPQTSWMGYVLEESLTPNFDEQSTAYVFRKSPSLHVSVRSPGNRYFRVRGVSAQRELTDFSQTMTLAIRLPEPPPVHVVQQSKKPAPKSTPAKSQAPTQVAKAEKTERTPAQAEPVPTPEPAPQPPASIAASVKPDPTAEYLNSSYRKSHFEFEGLNFIMASSYENATGGQIPLAGGIGAGIQHWFDGHLGASFAAKQELIGYNAAGRSGSLTDLEVRAAHRWVTPLHWFPFLRELQFAAVGGYEYYRNSNSNYATSYSVPKIGINLEFPIATRWETGGESFFGFINGGSHKYEASGHLHYYLSKRTLIGVGYRLNILDAESPDISPIHLLPYKEAYGEGYTTLMIHY